MTWADALEDAEKMLTEAHKAVLQAKRRVKSLSMAIAVCKERVASGEAFPCDRESGGDRTDFEAATE